MLKKSGEKTTNHVADVMLDLGVEEVTWWSGR
jgi:hypothetical protein